MPPERVRVAAGILRDSADNILIAERLADAAFAGLWEFPGGKCAPGESMEAALRRELREELGIDAGVLTPFMTLRHDYADRRVHLEFFLVESWSGEPKGLLGQALRWCRRDALDEGQLLPADVAVARALAELPAIGS